MDLISINMCDIPRLIALGAIDSIFEDSRVQASFGGKFDDKKISSSVSGVNDVVYDLSEFDVIALGTPVWAFGMAPAMRTYLDKCRNIAGKNILLFATYGSGAGKDRCISEMTDIVKNMGALKVMPVLVQERNVKNYRLVMDKIKKVLLNG